MLRFFSKFVFGILVLSYFSFGDIEEKKIQNPFPIFGIAENTNIQGSFTAQVGFFSSMGFGRVEQSIIKGGYTELYVSAETQTPEILDFSIGVGFSGLGLLHQVSGKDIYSNISTDEVGIGFRINNDEAKDFRYTSQPALLHTLYLQYRSDWGNIKVGRFPLRTEWIGDFVQGAGIYISEFGLKILAGWFDSQAYANFEENVNFGYIKKWYEEYEGYHIKNNYYLDITYRDDWIKINSYYNHFDTLFDVVGLRGEKLITLNQWYFNTEFVFAFTASSIQSPQACIDPMKVQNAGLSCYISDSIGALKGYLWGLEEKLVWRKWGIIVGYLQNDEKNSTNNLPIYADKNPLEYNTVVYGGGSKTSYVSLEYTFDGRGFLGVKYGMSWYKEMDINEIPLKHYSFQTQLNIVGEVNFKSANFKAVYANINDSIGYQNNIIKVILSYDF